MLNKRAKKTWRRTRRSGLRQRLPFPQRVKLFFVRLARLAIIVTITLAVGLLVVRVRDFVHSSYFDISEVRIEGISQSVEKIIRSRIDEQLNQKRNLLLLSTRAVKQSLADLCQLRWLDIKKKYPSTLIITGEERKPQAALVAQLPGVRGSKIFLVDAQCVAFETVAKAETFPSPLPCITGIPARYIHSGEPIKNIYLQYALDMIMALKESNRTLYKQLSEINIDEKQGLTVYLTGGTKLKLGKAYPIERLPELDAFLKKIKSAKRLRYADFRFNNQIVYVKK